MWGLVTRRQRFYDYDFSRGHRRLGLGTEAWTDYLKLSGNYYHPLSDWKESEDFEFYEERPARDGIFGLKAGCHFIHRSVGN